MTDQNDVPKTANAPNAASANQAALDLVNELFTYHPPEPDQIPKYTAIRDAARTFAFVLHESCPPSADRTAAMRQLQDCVMTANRSIALKGRSYR